MGRYRLVLELASGGMASVHVALADQRAGAHRVVAVKRLHAHLASDPTYREMFLDEARIASQIRHANVCTVFDYGAHDGAPHIVMEYLAGETVSAIWAALPRGASQPEIRRRTAVLARIVMDTCEALHAAHELRSPDGEPMDVVHRDVSPENLVVTYDGVVKLCDFGIAIAREQEHRTETGLLKGKYAYIPPEVLRGHRPDRRADLWSLGVVLWELLTGERLFRRPSVVETLQAVAESLVPAPSEALPGVPVEFDEVVWKALAPNPDDRFQTARELAKALDSAVTAAGKCASLGEVSEWMTEHFEGARASKEQLVELAVRRYEPVSGGSEPRESRSATVDADPPMVSIQSRPTADPVALSHTLRPLERLGGLLPRRSWSHPMAAFVIGALLTLALVRESSRDDTGGGVTAAGFMTTSTPSRVTGAAEPSCAPAAPETGMTPVALTEAARSGAAMEGTLDASASEQGGAERSRRERRYRGREGAPTRGPSRVVASSAHSAHGGPGWRQFVPSLQLSPAISGYGLPRPLLPDLTGRHVSTGWPQSRVAPPSKRSSRSAVALAGSAPTDFFEPPGAW